MTAQIHTLPRTIIRDFREEDIPEALLLARAFHSESDESHISFSEERVVGIFVAALSFPDTRFFMVGETDGVIEGGVYGQLVNYYFSNETMASERFMYVRPVSRGTFIATSLVSRFCQWAKDKGASEVMISPSAGCNTARTVHWLNSLGLATVGAITKRRIL